MREHSIRTNRRRKFVECIERDDVDIGTSLAHCRLKRDLPESHIAQLRKLAWNGVPDDLRPLVWPLLLVRL